MAYLQKQPPGSGPIRKLLFKGLFALLPVALTLWVVNFAFNLADGWFGPAVDAFVRSVVPASLLVGPFAGGHIPGLAFFVLLVVLVVVGGLTSFAFGSFIFRQLDYFISLIPGAGLVYKSTRKVGDLFANPKDTPFQKVVLIPFNGNVKALALVSGRTVDKVTGVPHLRVAVPTPPNPFSGLLFLVPEADCVDVEMTVEEGMQYFVSLGMVGPAEMSLTPRTGTGRGGEQ
ncbi:MAG: DUF502 domain-containing protein [Candidatus Melainabacteria bacterium]|nr:DUF502 domain-containing protein [Candidatus Melainabacteria bacterium]